MLMHVDSRQGTLPLAEAMIAWSDPALVEAIRTAEALVTPTELHLHERITLDRLATERRPPQLFRRMAFSEAIQRLDQAWDALFASFRMRVERADVTLEGFRRVSFGEPTLDVLPHARAAEFKFDPGAGAVFLGGQTYLSVRGSLNTAGVEAAASNRGLARRPAQEVLPLLAALIAWSDQSLVDSYKRFEFLAPGLLNRPSDAPAVRTSSDPEPAAESFTDWDKRQPKWAIMLAWAALLCDFRGRIEDGTLRPAGVQTWPLEETERKPIPHLWAADFKFDFMSNRIDVVRANVRTRSYMAV